MDTDALILVSVDDHLVEPPTLFDAHIPERYRDRAPKIVHTDIGDDVWMFDGEAVPVHGPQRGRRVAHARSTASSRCRTTRCGVVVGTSTSG